MNKQIEMLLRRILEAQVTDGGPGSGNHGHAGRPGQKGGSAKQGASVYSGKPIVGARHLRDSVFKKVMDETGGDCTCTLDGKPVSFESGYQVSFQTTGGEDKNSKHYLSDDEYDDLVNMLRKETGSEPFLGVFGEPEISFRCTSKKQAVALMEKFNQHSIWDWRAKDIIENKKLDKSTNNVGG